MMAWLIRKQPTSIELSIIKLLFYFVRIINKSNDILPILGKCSVSQDTWRKFKNSSTFFKIFVSKTSVWEQVFRNGKKKKRPHEFPKKLSRTLEKFQIEITERWNHLWDNCWKRKYPNVNEHLNLESWIDLTNSSQQFPRGKFYFMTWTNHEGNLA